MNKKLKRQLNTAFDAPAPIKKDEFLKALNYKKSSYSDFIFYQIGYIRKRVWISSFLLILSVIYGLNFLEFNSNIEIVYIISSAFPLVALVSITEILRSSSYNMAELEMSFKYSLSNVILTRMFILGVLDFIVFGFILVFSVAKTDYSFIRLGIYMLVPFLLSCALSLFVLNHFKIRETTYICGAVSCFVIALNSIVKVSYEILFEDKFFFLWAVIFCILIVLILKQVFKLLKKMEELNWNLPLTD